MHVRDTMRVCAGLIHTVRHALRLVQANETVSKLLQGVRIDYALVSPGLQEAVTLCEIVDTHPKWCAPSC